MSGREGDLAQLFAVSGALPDAVKAFFDPTLVLDPDPGVRATRRALLRRIVAVAVAVPEVDWTVSASHGPGDRPEVQRGRRGPT